MDDQAVYNTHPNVVAILDGKVCIDEKGNEVKIDALLVANESARLKTTPAGIALTNRPILEAIDSLDAKRIRPLAEDDASYLARLNKKIVVLRAKLV